MYKLRKTTRNIGYNMMGDIIQFPNAYQGNDRYEIQRAQELAWLNERIPAVQAKLNHLRICGSDPLVIQPVEVLYRNLTLRKKYLTDGGDPFAEETPYTECDDYPMELGMLDDMRETKLDEYEACEGEETEEYPEKLRLGKEYEEIDDLKNAMYDEWMAGKDFSPEEVRKVHFLYYRMNFPDGHDWDEVDG